MTGCGDVIPSDVEGSRQSARRFAAGLKARRCPESFRGCVTASAVLNDRSLLAKRADAA